MGDVTGISWCDRTCNLWIGCTKVSPGCKLCYAERDNERYHWTDRWGPEGTRHRTKMLPKLAIWNRERWFECQDCGWRGDNTADGLCPRCLHDGLEPTRQRVFINSLSDLFEDRPELVPWRDEFWKAVDACPNLDFLVLTKRPENLDRLIPGNWIFGLPPNIWWGISAENQEEFDARIPVLESWMRLRQAGVMWVSAEPLLGPIDMEAWLTEDDIGDEDAPMWSWPISWVVVGGESGPGCRPMDLTWARVLRNQCQEAEVAFYMKQLGGAVDRRERLEELPQDLRIREWPASIDPAAAVDRGGVAK